MYLQFTLSMPSNNSWNGKWTGENIFYAVVRKFGRTSTEKAKEILTKGYYSYNFGDGWRAAIDVKQIDSREAARVRKKSCGFCGYEWMINSIIEHGEIKC